MYANYCAEKIRYVEGNTKVYVGAYQKYNPTSSLIDNLSVSVRVIKTAFCSAILKEAIYV